MVDASSGKSSILRTGDGYYFGITYKDRVFALSHSTFSHASGFIKYYRLGSPPLISSSHSSHPHQIEWVENQVLVVSTGKNCLTVFDQDGRFVRDIYLNDIHWDDKDGDRVGNHFNSVHRAGDIVYVVAHNYDRPSEVWLLSWPELRMIDCIETKASWAHNVWAGELGLVICNSRHGSLYEVNSGETIWQPDEEKVISRGLAISGDYIFVGCSQYASRLERYWKTGAIWVIDRKTLKQLDKIMLPASGDVQEVRLIGDYDYCHNGQIIPADAVKSLQAASPLMAFIYHLRRRYPVLQKNIYPISVSIKGINMLESWRMSFGNRRAR
jgi:hypothetical protein